MVFGKRGNSDGSGRDEPPRDDTYQRQPVRIRRLIDAMQAIFDDACMLADLIRRGAPLPVSNDAMPHLSPIRCKGSETLFAHVDDKGETLYTTYHFTSDFKTMNFKGQYGLYVMYGRIYVVNALINRPPDGKASAANIEMIKAELDHILVKSAFYANFFRGYSLSTDLFLNRTNQVTTEREIEAHKADWVGRIERAKQTMFWPERLAEFIPERRPILLLAASGPFHEGQRVINGVHFGREHAEPLMAELAAQQARALADRMPPSTG